MKEYTVIYEWGRRNWSAYVPDLPGCIATGKTLDEVKQVMREAIAFHIEGLREEGLPIPEPTTLAEYVEAEA
jgi:predicted RNase H-like HicB family nuclease